MGIPDHFTCLLRNLYAGQEAIVRTGYGTIDRFKIGMEHIKAVCCFPAYLTYAELLLLMFNGQVMLNSLWPLGEQNARYSCPSLSLRVCSNSCSLSRWFQSVLILCHPLLLLPSIFPSIRVFSNELALHTRCLKYWSFNISPYNEYSGLMSFRIDWFGLCHPRDSIESSPALQFESINSFVLRLLYGLDSHIHTFPLETS